MAEQHPITPSPELVRQWNEAAATAAMPDQIYIATQAARWGADQELEACCRWIDVPIGLDDCRPGEESKLLRAARRPKPPSLKEQASKSLDKVVECLKMLVPGASVDGVHIETIRRALEALPDD